MGQHCGTCKCSDLRKFSARKSGYYTKVEWDTERGSGSSLCSSLICVQDMRKSFKAGDSHPRCSAYCTCMCHDLI